MLTVRYSHFFLLYFFFRSVCVTTGNGDDDRDDEQHGLLLITLASGTLLTARHLTPPHPITSSLTLVSMIIASLSCQLTELAFFRRFMSTHPHLAQCVKHLCRRSTVIITSGFGTNVFVDLLQPDMCKTSTPAKAANFERKEKTSSRCSKNTSHLAWWESAGCLSLHTVTLFLYRSVYAIAWSFRICV